MLDQATEPQPPGATTMLGARDLASRASTLATLVRGAEAAQACACVGEILTVDARPENRTSSSAWSALSPATTRIFARRYGGSGDEGKGSQSPPKTPSSFGGGPLSYLPASASPYARLMRLDKPIGSWLLAWPSFWSIALAANHGALPDPQMLALFGSGAVLLRGAGCTINDLWDRDLDSKVERTRGRPLAAKEISAASAIAFLGAQLSLGLGILMQLNTHSQLLGAASLPLVVAYPLMKRVTNWPQAVLGLTINWGALLGWSAVHRSLDLGVTLPLYLSGVAWTLVYDTVYAHQDKADDVKIGIRSTALHFGDNEENKRWLSGFAACHGLGLMASGVAAGCGWILPGAAVGGSALLLKRIRDIDLDNPEECAKFFLDSKWYGALVFAGIVADKVLV